LGELQVVVPYELTAMIGTQFDETRRILSAVAAGRVDPHATG